MRAHDVPELNEQSRCLKCDYLLRGLDSRTCPECGQAFDPADPGTYRLAAPFVAGRAQVAALVLLTLADLAYLTINGPHTDPPDVFLGLLGIQLSLCCAIGVARSERRWQQVLGWSCAAVQTGPLLAGLGTGVTWGQLIPHLAVYRGPWDYAHPAFEPFRVLANSWYFLLRYFVAPYLVLIGLTELWVRVRSRAWLWGVGLAVTAAQVFPAGFTISAMGYSGPGTGADGYLARSFAGPECAGMLLLLLPVRSLLFGVALRRYGRTPHAVPGRRVLLALEAAVLLLIMVLPVVAACGVPGAIAREGPRYCQRQLRGEGFFAADLFDEYVRANGHPPADLPTFAQWLGQTQANALGVCPVSGQPYRLERDPHTGEVFVVCPFHHSRSDPVALPFPTAAPAAQPGAAGP
jgi:hypothetical protein